MSLPVVIFDTSALSFLIKDGPRSAPHIAALTCGFDVWLTAMSVDELIATTDANKREELIAGCQRLLASGRCVWPPHEIVTLHASAHVSNPARFDWRGVNIRTRVYERAIIDRDYSNELCATQLREQRGLEDSFMEFWKGLRVKLEPILDANPKKRPTRYSQAAEIARSNAPSVLLGIGAELYKRGAKIERTPSGAEIESFMEVCPPFRSICYGVVGSWFDVSLARQVFKKLPGRNDQMMASYLPYCSRFVTADWRQGKRLREIALESKLDCEVLSYTDFLASFDLSRFAARYATASRTAR
jgi:hypothetical protein